MRTVAESASPEEFKATSGGPAPTCIVLGVSTANRATIEAFAALSTSVDDVSCVLVCERIRDAEVRLGLDLGIGGVVLAEDLERALVPVVLAVGAGQISVPQSVRSKVRAGVLTTREREILSMVVMGLTNGEIARRLFLAESTVKSHLSSAFAKLNVSSRNEAVMVILDPKRGEGLGILTIPAEAVPTRA